MYNKKSYTKWYKNNRDRKVDNVRKAFLQLRKRILELLGEKCAVCGYDKDLRILVVDHIEDNGAEERRTLGATWKYRKNMLDKIIAGSEDYQILCPNCNMIKEFDRKMRN